ncbi:AEC family transporter [Microbulbifer sp. VAAC004]|uniref:AEC family transporter n=1 Tax=unclassified Microbulbifer TaxID=2619833 RepID=UPI00403AF266
MEELAFSFSVISPIFLTMTAGYFFARFRVLEKQFVDKLSRFVFNITLPALLFFNIYMSDAGPKEEFLFLIAGVLGTFITIPMAFFLAFHVRHSDRSTFIHAAFRGNMAIVGLAWVESAYGLSGLAQGELLVAFVSIVYNAAAVVLLAYYSEDRKFSWKVLLKEIGKNPLIFSVLLALLLRELNVQLPQVLLQAGTEVGSITLPLALLCIGASFDFKLLRDSSLATFGASAIKLLLVPMAMLILGWLFRLEQQELGVLVLMAAVPSSSVCFVTAEGMGGNSRMAANIIGLSTLLSIITASFVLTIFKVLFE